MIEKARFTLRIYYICSDSGVVQQAVCYKNPLARNEAGDSEEIREAVKRFCKFFRNVDVGWERSEPSSIVKYLLPVSAVTNSHEVFEMMEPSVRFRLTETIYMKLQQYYFVILLLSH